MGKLAGRTALITGASSGIGCAIALLFAREGADVALIARNTAALEEVATQVRAFGTRAVIHSISLTDSEASRRAVDETVETFGRLDIMVSNAGTNVRERALTVLTTDEWERLLATNLSAAFHITQAALPPMRRQQDGLIAYISSIAVHWPDASGVAYQASKQGLVGLAHGTMEDDPPNRIPKTVVFPSLSDTPLLEQRPVPTPPEVIARALHPEDVAEACLFVAALPARVRIPELQIVASAL